MIDQPDDVRVLNGVGILLRLDLQDVRYLVRNTCAKPAGDMRHIL
jgi:hypothetical protein